jgi:hypothetical protein
MEPDRTPKTLTARATLSISGVRVDFEITVPTRLVGLGELLPTFRSLAGAIIDQAEREDLADGQKVSCRKGCGACCRQLVPIAEVEARQILDLVEGLPEPRRREIRDRFAEAGVCPVAGSGLLPARNPLPVPRRRKLLDPRGPPDRLSRVPRHHSGRALRPACGGDGSLRPPARSGVRGLASGRVGAGRFLGSAHPGARMGRGSHG